jgi:hypothetical protein
MPATVTCGNLDAGSGLPPLREPGGPASSGASLPPARKPVSADAFDDIPLAAEPARTPLAPSGQDDGPLLPTRSGTLDDDSDDEEEEPRFSLWAVVAGVAVDIGASIVLSIVLGLAVAAFWVVVMIFRGPLYAPRDGSAELPFLLGCALGSLSTAIGGYAAAAIGKHWPLRHALAMGIVSALLGLATWAMLPAALTRQSSTAQTFISLALAVPAACLGGYVQMKFPRDEW